MPSVIRDLVILIARIGIGVVFVAHGWQKLVTMGVGTVAAGFKQSDIPLPTVSAWYATLVEFIGGVMLIIGLGVPVAGVLLAINMLGAYLFVHIGHGLFVEKGGAELVIALGLGSLLLAVVGAGLFSLDHLIGPRLSWRPARQRTAVGG